MRLLELSMDETIVKLDSVSEEFANSVDIYKQIIYAIEYEAMYKAIMQFFTPMPNGELEKAPQFHSWLHESIQN